MHHESIKAEIRAAGSTLTAIADELGVSVQTVSAVIRGTSTSDRVAQLIAKLIKRPVGQLWPGRYPSNQRQRARAVAAAARNQLARKAA